MVDILHDFPVATTPARLFEAITSPDGLNEWWTKTSAGIPIKGTTYNLGFGAEYQWRATVTQMESGRVFALAFTEAMEDWKGTEMIIELEERDGLTWVHFAHRGWIAADDHHRVSSFCWAMYLRILKRYLEHGERVAYEHRLDV